MIGRGPALGLALALASAPGCAARQMETAAPSRAAAERPGGGVPALAAQPGQGAQRYLVRRATLGLTVEDLDATRRRAAALASSLGGYVQSSETVDRDRLRLTARIPTAALDAALDSLAALGRVTARRVSAEDVTDQVVDLDARLASMRLVRDRLRQHLERAVTVADVVAVERELARVQADVDALEARLTHLRSSAALAELTVEATRRRVLGPLGLLLAGTATLIGKLFVWR